LESANDRDWFGKDKALTECLESLHDEHGAVVLGVREAVRVKKVLLALKLPQSLALSRQTHADVIEKRAIASAATRARFAPAHHTTHNPSIHHHPAHHPCSLLRVGWSLLAHELVYSELADPLDLVQGLVGVPQRVELTWHLPTELVSINAAPNILAEQRLGLRVVRAPRHGQKVCLEERATDKLDEVDLKPALHLPRPAQDVLLRVARPRRRLVRALVRQARDECIRRLDCLPSAAA
jgi:hypothetical protein